MNDLISIVIPAYNIENYLSKTLDSILSQTYKDIEIIVVNDGSKDNTGTIIDEYANKYKNIKGVHKENGGVTSARIRGVKESQGEWIGFVDGDDLVDPEMFEVLINNAKEHNADISHCGYKMIFPNGKIDYYYNTKKKCIQNNIEALRDIVSGAVYEPALYIKIYKRELFDKLLSNDLMDLSIKNFEDLLMNYYLFKEAKISVYEDICLYHYVLRKNSAATSKINEHKLCDPKKVIKIIHDDICEDLKDCVYDRYVRQLINLATCYADKSYEFVKIARKESRKELRKNCFSILKSKIGTKTKIKAFWVATWAWSYSMIHRIHGKITGNSTKYNID